MKVYIIFDMEGCSGIVDWRKVTLSDPASSVARRLATLDLNAVVQGAIVGGATEIVAWDGHSNFPGSLDLELLDPACHLITNAAAWGPVGLDASFAAVFLCGLHAMAGSYGLPNVFISGDEAAVAEETRASLSEGAAQAMGLVRSIGAFTMARPYRMVTRWQTEEQAAAAIAGPGSTLLDPLTVETITTELRF
jgi:D-aminopeptidase